MAPVPAALSLSFRVMVVVALPPVSNEVATIAPVNVKVPAEEVRYTLWSFWK